jgi:hypothetical protein
VRISLVKSSLADVDVDLIPLTSNSWRYSKVCGKNLIHQFISTMDVVALNIIKWWVVSPKVNTCLDEQQTS